MLITKMAIKWKSSVFLLMIVFSLFGSIAYKNLPREANPDIPIPYIFITTVYMGVSPADMESLVTLKIENELRGIKGVKEIISYSAESVSNISIEFMPEVDTDMALQRVRDKVDQAMNELPDDLTEEPIITEISMSDFPVFVVAISGDMPESDLKKIADDMQDVFEGIEGVLEVELSGARDREILVVFDYERMQSYSLTINDLSNAIRGEHINIPGGSMDIGQGKYLIRIPGEYTNIYDMENIVVTVRDKQPVYLRDVAVIEDSFEDKDSYARINGKQAISVSIKKRSGANILKMADDIKAAIKSAEEEYPPSVKFTLTT
ncbi:MAG: efflux RND transporter permease subunit, partial [Mucispirillum sp.]|nr:efflux RND transporter permease subunit [Mucispirillum sp.]